MPSQEEALPDSLHTLVLVQGALTALSGGFNAVYFARYSASDRSRRIASRVLALVNLSFLLQGLYWAGDAAGDQVDGPPPWPGLVTLLASLAITAMVVRRRYGGGRSR